MNELGVQFYRGPSLLTGEPIVGVLTGLDGGSHNPKTGPMAQAWVLRADLAPMDAKRANLDDAICGDCKLRGRDGKDSGCYVAAWVAPTAVYKRLAQYPIVTWPELQAVVEGRSVRLCAYGDPAAVPFEIWRTMLEAAAGFVCYTHAWKRCDRRFRAIAMASVDTEAEFWDAREAGWRTFRIRMPHEPLLVSGFGRPLEFACPASDEMQHRTTCERCQLCRGASSPARSVAIIAHGKPSSLKAFGIRVPMFGRTPWRPYTGPNQGPVSGRITPEPPLLRAKFYRGRSAPDA
jgi:hypothetical protein